MKWLEIRYGREKAEVLVPGEWYRITLEDCCVCGTIIGQFFGYWNEIETVVDDGFEYEYLLSPEPEEDFWSALFSFGILGEPWGAWYPTRITQEKK